ncbi:hypothetical protein FACS1894198_7040 [Clostridia bacterium]|nr:hypothetical protein FACS1894198_7040 [Clostridia bacterium]
MVGYEEALKKLWKDKCSVFIQVKTQNLETKMMEFSEQLLFEDEPCKLSFETLKSAGTKDDVATISQIVKLFISKELRIPAGSKIVVTRDEQEFNYRQSGAPGIFSIHQEIPLQLFERYA